jgi:hypothetical protein
VKHLFRKDSGNLISKVADTPEAEQELRAQGFEAAEELWPTAAKTLSSADTIAEQLKVESRKGKKEKA